MLPRGRARGPLSRGATRSREMLWMLSDVPLDISCTLCTSVLTVLPEVEAVLKVPHQKAPRAEGGSGALGQLRIQLPLAWHWNAIMCFSRLNLPPLLQKLLRMVNWYVIPVAPGGQVFSWQVAVDQQLGYLCIHSCLLRSPQFCLVFVLFCASPLRHLTGSRLREWAADWARRHLSQEAGDSPPAMCGAEAAVIRHMSRHNIFNHIQLHACSRNIAWAVKNISNVTRARRAACTGHATSRNTTAR